MAHKLITSVHRADRILKNVRFTGNFNIFAQVQPKRLELRQFLSQLSSHPPNGFDKPFSQRKGHKSGVCTAGGILDRKSSSLSGGTDSPEGDEEKGKVGPGGKNDRQIFRGNAGILGVSLVYLNHKDFNLKGVSAVDNNIETEWPLPNMLKQLDEISQKLSNIPFQQVTDGKNEKESVPANLAQLVSAAISAMSTDPQIQCAAVNAIHELLTSDRKPPIESIDFLIRCNILPTLVDCLSSPNPTLQSDALWILKEIVSRKPKSKLAQAVLEAGAVPHFLRLLTSSPNKNICNEAFWTLGLIIVRGPQLRDCVINLGVVAPLLNCIQSDTSEDFVSTFAFLTIAILFLHKDMPPPSQTVRQILPSLNVLVHDDIPEVVLITAWALKNLIDGGIYQMQMVLDSGALPKLVQLLNHSKVEVQEIAARAVWNIVAKAYGQMKAVLNCDALSHFHNQLNHPKTCQGALSVLAMVIAKNFATVQAIIDAKLVPLIVHHLEKGEFQTQKAAALAVRCMTISLNKKQVGHLIDCGVIPPLWNLLNSKDSEVVHNVLVGLHNFLLWISAYQEGADKVCTLIEEYDGWTRIKALQHHEDMEICKIAHEVSIIIEKYLSDDD